jgi:hypothetical protein
MEVFGILDENAGLHFGREILREKKAQVLVSG